MASEAEKLKAAIQNQRIYQVGASPLVWGIMETLGIEELTDEQCPPGDQTISHGRTTVGMVLNRLIKPKAMYKVGEWLGKTGLADWLGHPAEEFNDDRKDAGELGAGHTVTALYELIPAGSDEAVPEADELRYQTAQLTGSDDLMTVKLRYKRPGSEESRLLVRSVRSADYRNRRPSDNFRFASQVAEFGLLLRKSEYKGEANYDQVIRLARAAQGEDTEGYRAEFIRLVEKARKLDFEDSE